MAPKFAVGDKVEYSCYYRDMVANPDAETNLGTHIDGKGTVLAVLDGRGTRFVSDSAYVIGRMGRFIVLDESVLTGMPKWKKVKNGHLYSYNFKDDGVYRRLKS